MNSRNATRFVDKTKKEEKPIFHFAPARLHDQKLKASTMTKDYIM